RLDEPALPADDFAPVAKVVLALPGQLGFRRECVMHPDQRARPCRHSGANSAFVEHALARARWNASEQPTTPAPITTMFALDAVCVTRRTPVFFRRSPYDKLIAALVANKTVHADLSRS